MIIELDIPFRGSRKYLQGGDIYRAFANHIKHTFDFETISLLRLKFNTLSYFGLNAIYWQSGTEPQTQERGHGSLWFEFNDGKRFEGKFLPTNRSVTTHIDGHEHIITEQTELNGNCAKVGPVNNVDLIEHIIFATRKMHNHLLPKKNARWIVVEFKLNTFLDNLTQDTVKISLENNHNDTITESSIYLGNSPVGSIIFMSLNHK